MKVVIFVAVAMAMLVCYAEAVDSYRDNLKQRVLNLIHERELEHQQRSESQRSLNCNDVCGMCHAWNEEISATCFQECQGSNNSADDSCPKEVGKAYYWCYFGQYKYNGDPWVQQ